MQTTIGGDRLGSGNKQNVQMRNFERSTHDLSYLWRSSMSAGTLVPFMVEVGLPGDSFDIKLNTEVYTLPTVGPLYGSYKVQLDVFECPMRLYNGKLHMNMLNIGMDMSKILLPQIKMKADFDINKDENQQINPSSIFSYLNIRGLGRSYTTETEVKREFNGIPYLAYWDIYKQYYANKQEERGFVVHTLGVENQWQLIEAELYNQGINEGDIANGQFVDFDAGLEPDVEIKMYITWDNQGEIEGDIDWSTLIIEVNETPMPITELMYEVSRVPAGSTGKSFLVTFGGWKPAAESGIWQIVSGDYIENTIPPGQGKPKLEEFPLDNIDNMRMDILQSVKSITPFIIDENTEKPYGLSLKKQGIFYSKLNNQEGLGIKTYQSDLFNNWISTEWIDGTNGINAITSVSTAGNEFTIDALNLANKVYNMLNRIAISGGSYDDWLDAQYTHERMKSVENPVYHGSLIKELGFEEVVSNSNTEVNGQTQPLGTLAGRGRMTDKNKGGIINIKCNEPCYIMGIVSLTPRVDYSTVNKWDINLKNMGELHVPSLDAIGYQDLVTDQLAWFDTRIKWDQSIYFKSAGKQPAWINYMTNVNQVKGNFAIENNAMFMTLNRRYEMGGSGIQDLTTYIDPSKFNNIFAETSLDSQNFWVQIAIDNTARRKMSAKVIPNL